MRQHRQTPSNANSQHSEAQPTGNRRHKTNNTTDRQAQNVSRVSRLLQEEQMSHNVSDVLLCLCYRVKRPAKRGGRGSGPQVKPRRMSRCRCNHTVQCRSEDAVCLWVAGPRTRPSCHYVACNVGRCDHAECLAGPRTRLCCLLMCGRSENAAFMPFCGLSYCITHLLSQCNRIVGEEDVQS